MCQGANIDSPAFLLCCSTFLPVLYSFWVLLVCKYANLMHTWGMIHTLIFISVKPRRGIVVQTMTEANETAAEHFFNWCVCVRLLMNLRVGLMLQCLLTVIHPIPFSTRQPCEFFMRSSVTRNVTKFTKRTTTQSFRRLFGKERMLRTLQFDQAHLLFSKPVPETTTQTLHQAPHR